jgi:SAM-dependent methyltransferase
MATHGDRPGYWLKAVGREDEEAERLDTLQALYDPLSRARRSFVEPGWRCLEIGGGRGSLAAWLAEQVGRGGEVVATDVDTRYLERLDLPNLRVVRHDILEDPLDVLEPGSFDLVSARLVLFWLPGRQQEVIARMVECLRPGGWLIDEDGDWGAVGPVDPGHPLTAPHDAAYRQGAHWADRGYDSWFGRTLPVLFERAGLVDIAHEATTAVVPGASPWARWWVESLETIAAQEPGSGTDAATLAAMGAPFRDPSCWVMRELLHVCRGRRPGR